MKQTEIIQDKSLSKHYKRITPFIYIYVCVYVYFFSFRQTHFCLFAEKASALQKVPFTGASLVNATLLGHHSSMGSPTLLTYHMKVNSGDPQIHVDKQTRHHAGSCIMRIVYFFTVLSVLSAIIDFLQKYPRCLHIDAIAFLMERYDARENQRMPPERYHLVLG